MKTLYNRKNSKQVKMGSALTKEYRFRTYVLTSQVGVQAPVIVHETERRAIQLT